LIDLSEKNSTGAMKLHLAKCTSMNSIKRQGCGGARIEEYKTKKRLKKRVTLVKFHVIMELSPQFSCGTYGSYRTYRAVEDLTKYTI
jgi:hypothetical protein